MRRARRRPALPLALLLLLFVAAMATAAARLDLLSFGTASGDPSRAQVVRVVDGDTIRVRIQGREYPVRYIGIDTPEVDPRRTVEPLGREATERNRALVQGKIVTLERDVSERDRFGRLLRYVYLDGRMVNAVLVEEGYARAVAYPPDLKHQDLFIRLEREAREARHGLWRR